LPHHAHAAAAHDVLQAVSIADESHWFTHCTPIYPIGGHSIGVHRRQLR
jgi:hypothetical protein